MKVPDPCDVGVSGNVLVNEEADRVNSYNIWNYAEGQDSYYTSMLVDLTKPPDNVSNTSPIEFLNIGGIDVRCIFFYKTLYLTFLCLIKISAFADSFLRVLDLSRDSSSIRR